MTLLPFIGRENPVVKPVRSEWVMAGTVLWILAADNLSFWRHFWGAQTQGSIEALFAGVALSICLLFAFLTILRLLSWPYLAKPVMIGLLLTCAVIAHFVDTWGVYFDKGMVRNVLQTDIQEASDLMTVALMVDFAIRGVLPALIVLFVPIQPSRPSALTKAAIATSLITLLVAGAASVAFYSIYAPTFRNHRDLRFQLVPSNFLSSAYSLLKPKRTVELQEIAVDAVRGSASTSQRPLILVLVVGETARAENFSLGGYGRPTNKALAAWNVMYSGNVMACGTDTATSLPCMFSDMGAKDFDQDNARSRQNVLDVLKRLGIGTLWIENNSGCKGVCDRTRTLVASKESAAGCMDGTCMDEALPRLLQRELPAIQSDAIVVLHQQGSHGPAYYKRYPQPGAFQPTCDTNQIQTCERATLINTYDNTIDYTSQILAMTIDVVDRRRQAADYLVLYISDHGESLGEAGVYLHGLPKFLAPRQQMQIPILMWLSDEAEERLRARRSCLSNVIQKPLSHDNLFHTLLGLYNVKTAAYDPALDIFSMARSNQCS